MRKIKWYEKTNYWEEAYWEEAKAKMQEKVKVRILGNWNAKHI